MSQDQAQAAYRVLEEATAKVKLLSETEKDMKANDAPLSDAESELEEKKDLYKGELAQFKSKNEAFYEKKKQAANAKKDAKRDFDEMVSVSVARGDQLEIFDASGTRVLIEFSTKLSKEKERPAKAPSNAGHED